MTLKEARALQAAIRAAGLACKVPLGHGPDGYWCEITSALRAPDGKPRTVTFFTAANWLDYRRAAEQARRAEAARSRPRSPIEMMIDAACGLEGGGRP